MTLFTDREAAVEEMEWLVAEIGRAHAIVSERDGRENRWLVVPVALTTTHSPSTFVSWYVARPLVGGFNASIARLVRLIRLSLMVAHSQADGSALCLRYARCP